MTLIAKLFPAFALAVALSVPACDGETTPNDADTNGDDATTPDTDVGDRTPVDLTGVVIDGYGLPLADAKVAVGSRTTATDAAGRFTLSAVLAPYDIQVAPADGNFAIEYQGVGRADPTLTVPIGTDPADTAVSGSLGGEVDLDGQNRATVIPVGEGFGFEGVSNTVEGLTTFGPLFAKHWKTPATVRLYALQWDVATPGALGLWPAPTSYLAFGISDPFELAGTSTSAGVTLSAAAVAGSGRITGAVTLPSGYTLYAKRHWVSFAPNADMMIYYDDAQNPAIDVVTPRLGAVAGDPSFGIEVVATGPAGESAWVAVTGLGADASGVAASVPTPPTGLSAGDTFRWTKSSPVSWVVFRPNESNGPEVWVVTAASQTALPDFSAVGVSVPGGRSYRFGVAALASLTDLEAATGDKGITDPWVRFTLGMFAEADGGLVSADEVVFTTP